MLSSQIDRIRPALAKGFESDVFEAAMRNLSDLANPLRFNNFSYAARETVRHVLYRMAPDPHVMACCWYRKERGQQGGVTRRQRAYYAVQGGLSDEFVKQSLDLDTDEMISTLLERIDSLSKFTHIQLQPECFALPLEEVDRLVALTLGAGRRTGSPRLAGSILDTWLARICDS